MNARFSKTLTALALAAAVVVASCSTHRTVLSTTSPTTPAAPTGAQRIVSMSASATEMLFAVGAGAQVVAADSNSNYPAGAPKTKLSAYEPNAEAIARYRPDLVVISDDTNHIKAQLTTLHIAVVRDPAAKTLEDTYAQITDLGARSGHPTEATALVASMRARVAELTKDLPQRAKPLTYFHELDNTLYSITSKTFIGQLYGLAGLRNIADTADHTGSGYPQLSAEYLVRADPDLVLLGDTKCCAQTAATFAKRPGFSGLKAVHAGHVILLDDDVASRWGPRVVDFLAQIVDVVKAVPAT